MDGSSTRSYRLTFLRGGVEDLVLETRDASELVRAQGFHSLVAGQWSVGWEVAKLTFDA